jgi:hypothetical protein|tara:strand:- start:87 stop:275 length:189 start_codon:yes stop_codon:yes gene_type:complete
MKKYIILISVLFLTGCATLDQKIADMKLAEMPWPDDKPLMLNEPFQLGPLQYDDMLIALRDV